MLTAFAFTTYREISSSVFSWRATKQSTKIFFGKKKKFVKSKHYINCGTRILMQRGKKFLKHYLYFNHHLCPTLLTSIANVKNTYFFNLKMTTKWKKNHVTIFFFALVFHFDVKCRQFQTSLIFIKRNQTQNVIWNDWPIY